MKKLIVRHGGFNLRVHISNMSTSIIDSFLIKTPWEMDFILHLLKREGEDTDAINIRTVSSMIDEWRTYNLLYTLGILRSKFKTIELNATLSWYSKILYTALSPFYFHFF